MTKELTITKTYDLAKPAEVVTMANVLKEYVVKQQLYTNIKGKNYAHVDGWQFAGFLSGMNAIVEDIKDLSNDKEIKWSAFVRLYHGDKVIGTGYALCSNREAIKKSFDEYAILSMAQTRAIGKAYRNKIGWIMKLAGYESTPSEEMHKVGETPAGPKQPAPAQSKKPSQPAKAQAKETPAGPNSPTKEKLFELARKYGAQDGKETKLIEATLKMKVDWAKCSETQLKKVHTLYLSKMVN